MNWQINHVFFAKVNFEKKYIPSFDLFFWFLRFSDKLLQKRMQYDGTFALCIFKWNLFQSTNFGWKIRERRIQTINSWNVLSSSHSICKENTIIYLNNNYFKGKGSKKTKDNKKICHQL